PRLEDRGAERAAGAAHDVLPRQRDREAHLLLVGLVAARAVDGLVDPGGQSDDDRGRGGGGFAHRRDGWNGSAAPRRLPRDAASAPLAGGLTGQRSDAA